MTSAAACGHRLSTTQPSTRMVTPAVPITEMSHVAVARRTALQMAYRLGLSETESGALALVVTEAATNLVKHAQAGQILLRALEEADGAWRGAARAGYRPWDGPCGPVSAGWLFYRREPWDGARRHHAPGHPVGPVFRAWARHGRARAGRAPGGSRPGAGGCLRRAAPGPLAVGVVCVPYPGRDGVWGCLDGDPAGGALPGAGGGWVGPRASGRRTPRTPWCRRVGSSARRTPEELLATAHAAAQGTRGAAVGLAEIDTATQVVRFAGVGNIAGVVWTATGSRGLASHNGIVGHDMRRRQAFTAPWSPDAVVVLHSDGLQTRWRLDAYARPGAPPSEPHRRGALSRFHARAR